MADKLAESGFLLLDLSFLVGIGDEGEETGVGVESLVKLASLLLNLGQVVVILRIGGLEGEGKGEKLESVGSVAEASKGGGQVAGDIGGGGIVLASQREVLDSLR